MTHHYRNLSACVFLCAFSLASNAESLRCKGDIVQVGDTKSEVTVKCGDPEMTDSFCEKFQQKIRNSDGTFSFFQSCENVDIWTYNPGKGQFWTNLYFAQGKLREMRYGKRVD
jgi:hypothetical protein